MFFWGKARLKPASLGLIDINEQVDVKNFMSEAVEQLRENPALGHVSLESFLLPPHGLECDFDFSSVAFSSPITHLFWHTKTLKSSGGAFKDELFIDTLLAKLNLSAEVKIWFYSGDIEEFKSHLNWMEKRCGRTLLPATCPLVCCDVFDLLYPPDDDSMEQWLEREVLKV
jgi:hypothetical protein